jgi:hypothetical protein
MKPDRNLILMIALAFAYGPLFLFLIIGHNIIYVLIALCFTGGLAIIIGGIVCYLKGER